MPLALLLFAALCVLLGLFVSPWYLAGTIICFLVGSALYNRPVGRDELVAVWRGMPPTIYGPANAAHPLFTANSVTRVSLRTHKRSLEKICPQNVTLAGSFTVGGRTIPLPPTSIPLVVHERRRWNTQPAHAAAILAYCREHDERAVDDLVTADYNEVAARIVGTNPPEFFLHNYDALQEAFRQGLRGPSTRLVQAGLIEQDPANAANDLLVIEVTVHLKEVPAAIMQAIADHAAALTARDGALLLKEMEEELRELAEQARHQRSLELKGADAESEGRRLANIRWAVTRPATAEEDAHQVQRFAEKFRPRGR